MHILHLLHQHRQIDMDYLTLLLNTYINEKDIFSEVIQNRQIQFEKEHSISKKEFYFNCRKVVESINSKIEDRFYKRQNELCQIIDLKEAKGEPTINFETELNTLQKNQFPINLLHLTADKFRGDFFLTDVNFIETSLNELQYISEAEKTQVRNKLLPHWLFYRVEHEVIDIAYKQMNLDFEYVQKYEVLIKQMIRISEKIFFEQIAPLDRKEFITVLNDQYNNYNLKCLDMTDWLNATYKLITKGSPRTEINIQSKSEFLEWYKEKIKAIKPKAPQQIKTNNTDEVKKEFKDFFNPDVEIETITKIQNEFKEYYGKKMAVLIYLLETKFKVLSYSLDSKTDGRKHLVDSLNNSKPNMQPINKCFITYSYKLDITKFENDKDFINIKEKLLKTIK